MLTLYPRAQAILHPAHLSLLPVSMYPGMKRAVGNARYSCQLLISQHYCHASLRNSCALYSQTPLELASGRLRLAPQLFRIPTFMSICNTAKVIYSKYQGVVIACNGGQTSFSPCKKNKFGNLLGCRRGGLQECVEEGWSTGLKALSTIT